MRRVVKAVIVLAAGLLVSVPAPARADGFINPWGGIIFNSPDSVSGSKKTVVGLSAGSTGNVVGAELEFGYSPSFFGSKGEFGTNTLITGMFNAIITVPVASNWRERFLPYIEVGTGLIRTQIGGTVLHPESKKNTLGFNVGGGGMGYFSKHVGLRADVRYFRNISGDVEGGIDLGNLHFWRASAGFALR